MLEKKIAIKSNFANNYTKNISVMSSLLQCFSCGRLYQTRKTNPYSKYLIYKI